MGCWDGVRVAAGDVCGDWRAGNRVWRSGYREAVGDFEGNCQLTRRVSRRLLKVSRGRKNRKKEKKKTQRGAKEKREEAKDRTDVRNAAKRKQHAAPLDDCRGTGS